MLRLAGMILVSNGEIRARSTVVRTKSRHGTTANTIDNSLNAIAERTFKGVFPSLTRELVTA